MSEQNTGTPEQQNFQRISERLRDGVRVLDPAHPLETKDKAAEHGFNGAVLGVLTLPAEEGKYAQEIAFIDYGEEADTPRTVPKYNDGSGKHYLNIFGYAESRFGVQPLGVPEGRLLGYVPLTRAEPGDPNHGYDTFGRASYDRNPAITRNSYDLGLDTSNIHLSAGHFSVKVEGEGNAARVMVAVHSTNINTLEYMAPAAPAGSEVEQGGEVRANAQGLLGGAATAEVAKWPHDDGTDGNGLITHVPKF